MEKNVFVLGLEEQNLKYLKRLRGAEELNFHPLLDYSEIRGSEEFPAEALLQKCRDRLDSFLGSIDGIIGYFDFPVTIMQPILSGEQGLPAASLEAVLKCEHKYWSRLEQLKAIKDHIPMFEAFDPFDERPLAGISLLFPYWIKPAKSFRSYLAFRINDRNGFDQAIEEIRPNIHRISEPFEFLLEKQPLPPEVSQYGGEVCVAESLLSGSQCTLEGYVQDGEVYVYGVVDSIRAADRSSFLSYEYPSQLPKHIKNHMVEIATRIMSHIHYDNAPFNIEFFYNQTEDSISLLEINPRVSQSHAYLFEAVDGVSNMQVAVDLAVGRKVQFPYREGQYKCAAKFMLRSYEDGIVTRIPSPTEVERITQDIPGTEVELLVRPGVRLSELHNQDSYSYELADIYVGGDSRADVRQKYKAIVDHLQFGVILKPRSHF